MFSYQISLFTSLFIFIVADLEINFELTEQNKYLLVLKVKLGSNIVFPKNCLLLLLTKPNSKDMLCLWGKQTWKGCKGGKQTWKSCKIVRTKFFTQQISELFRMISSVPSIQELKTSLYLYTHIWDPRLSKWKQTVLSPCIRSCVILNIFLLISHTHTILFTSGRGNEVGFHFTQVATITFFLSFHLCKSAWKSRNFVLEPTHSRGITFSSLTVLIALSNFLYPKDLKLQADSCLLPVSTARKASLLDCLYHS